jgi:hypothetical protein
MCGRGSQWILVAAIASRVINSATKGERLLLFDWLKIVVKETLTIKAVRSIIPPNPKIRYDIAKNT